MNKSIYYFNASDVPSRAANVIQSLSFAHSLSSVDNIFLKYISPNYHHLPRSAYTERLKSFFCKYFLDIPSFEFFLIGLPFASHFLTRLWFYLWSLAFFILLKVLSCFLSSCCIVYTRDPFLAFLSSVCRLNTALELHLPLYTSKFYSRLFSPFTLPFFIAHLRVVYIGEALKNIEQNKSLHSCKEIVLRDGAFDVLSLHPRFSSVSADPTLLNFTYVGSIIRGRGIDIILHLARLHPQHRFNIVGGTPSQVNTFLSYQPAPPSNVVFWGFLQGEEKFSLLSGSDCFLAPYQPGLLISSSSIDTSSWMSPLKFFEYSSFGKPIISSDFLSLREIFSSDEVFYVPPSDLSAWEHAISLFSTNSDSFERRAKLAFIKFKSNYLWSIRAEKFLSFMGVD